MFRLDSELSHKICVKINLITIFFKIFFYYLRANREEMRVKSTASNGTSSVTSPTITTAPTAVLVQNEEVPVSSLPNKATPTNNQVVYWKRKSVSFWFSFTFYPVNFSSSLLFVLHLHSTQYTVLLTNFFFAPEINPV